ncbi:diacylglycerol O-acyltransferase 1 isoform X4 [Apis mellifera]|uniref:O-acyltransferase n=1 Tax=Apis mellifera TaxID=7460 RepID=A0A7M7GMR8_APIME|nr:diacylglycerol O-acyltransferase 1 isoform X4 [Apis mellifera]|eukprot:XP_006560375.1 diacylglycerol O-acyltransferase 1 isoform X4 [Apis mellifera]
MEHENDTRVRLRRTKSETRAEEIQKAEQMVRKSQPDKPCHRPRDSLFSWSSGFDNFTGFVNWGFLLLGIGGIRLLLENFIKYGIRVDPWQWFLFLSGTYEGGEEHPSILLIIYSTVPIGLCLLIEKGLSLDIIAHGPGMVFHIVNLIVMVLMPMVVIHVKDSGFSLSSTAKQNGEEVDDSKHEVDVAGTVLVQYPDNLTFRDLYYFILAPTLCYELNFPRTQRIRKRFLIKRILEVVVGCQVVMSLFQQWMVPCVKNSLVPFSNMDVAKASERLLKLAIPNHLVWLCFFYLTFHSLLNLVGELLHFADRNFYCDWWNAHNIDIFWRTWNMPVHRWAVRHLYIPIIEMGYKKNTASVTVFFISAFFHEYLVSVPLKTFKTWAFLGMMGQIPLSMISKKVEKHWGARWGNITVWASLIIGQPLCIMMYYHDYVITHFGENLIEDYSVV